RERRLNVQWVGRHDGPRGRIEAPRTRVISTRLSECGGSRNCAQGCQGQAPAVSLQAPNRPRSLTSSPTDNLVKVLKRHCHELPTCGQPESCGSEGNI